MLDYLTQDQVKEILEDLPSGSGFNYDWKVLNNIENCCTIETFYSVMDCLGGYDGQLHIMLNIDVSLYNESKDLYVASELNFIDNSRGSDSAYDVEGNVYPWFEWYVDLYSEIIENAIFRI